MKAKKSSGPVGTLMLEPDPVSQPVPSAGAPRPAGGPAVNPASERDYWHVNYMTRPYYKEGRSFGDYEAAYRYGWENAAMPEGMTFEAAEKAHLARGWDAARGKSAYAWDEVREAVHDAWTRARRHLVK